MYVDRESTVFAAHSSSPTTSGSSMVALHPPPPLLQSIPGPLLSPHKAFYLVTDLPSEPIWTALLPQRWALWACEVRLKGYTEIWSVEAQDPTASPRWPTLLPVLCGHLDRMTPFNPHQACSNGESWAGWVGSDKLGRLTMALDLLQVELGVSRVHPERKGLCSVFLCHASFSLSLSPSCSKLWA